MSEQKNPAEFAQAFEDRAQLTQMLYQTLIQSVARSQPKDSKGVTAVEAELLHSLSASAAGIVSRDAAQRRTAWANIANTAQFALQVAEAAAIAAQNATPEVPVAPFEPVDD
jgi:hypothetical protein